MQFFNQNWPLILLISWFSYRWVKAFWIKKKLPELVARGAYLIDVRSPAEFQSASAPGSINIPLGEVVSGLKNLKTDRPIVVACASGMRSAKAKALFKKHGFSEVYNIGSWTNF